MAATILAAVRGVVQKTLLGQAAGDAFNVYDQQEPEDLSKLQTPYAVIEDGGCQYILTTENVAEARRVAIRCVSKSQDNAEAMALEASAALTTTSYPQTIPTPTVPPFVVAGADLTYSKPDTGQVTFKELQVGTGKVLKCASITMRIRVTRESS